MTGKHWPLAASAAPLWGNCSGSHRANAGAPNLDTPETLAGTAAHWVWGEVLTHIKNGAPIDHMTCVMYLGKLAPNGVIIDEAIVEGAQIYVDEILRVALKYDAVDKLMIEQPVRMAHIHRDNGGTLDTALYIREKNLLFLWDYKHGHRENSPVGNKQLINYIAGLVPMLGITGHTDQITKVSATIVSPYCYMTDDVNAWDFKLSDLRGDFNKLHAMAHEAYNDPKLSSGKWCRDCWSVGRCSEARRAGYNTITAASQPYNMDDMNPADLAAERDILLEGATVVKARLKAIEDELMHRISEGKGNGSGLLLESSQGRLKWTVPVDQAISFAQQFGVDAAVKAVLTPTQALAAAPSDMKPMFKQVLSSVASRPLGKNKLINADETKAARAFKPKTTET